MCFAKSSPTVVKADPVIAQEPVVRKEADASLTKNVKDEKNKGAFLQNIKTSAYGLSEVANVQKKTLLGE